MKALCKYIGQCRVSQGQCIFDEPKKASNASSEATVELPMNERLMDRPGSGLRIEEKAQRLFFFVLYLRTKGKFENWSSELLSPSVLHIPGLYLGSDKKKS